MGLLRPRVERLAPYVPGEQPQEPGWVKLNTNENPYVAPAVVAAIGRAATDPHNLYPDPTCRLLRERLSAAYGVPAAQIIVGNGSDELLELVLRACADEGDRIVVPYPTYSLYRTLAEIHAAHLLEIDLGEQFELPVSQLVAANGQVTFVAQPNAPTGTVYPLDALGGLCEGVAGVVVVDEAYIDFAAEGCSALSLLPEHPNLLVVRTMSKGLGIAGLRVGYAFGSPELIEGLYKVKDSYNVNRITQVAAIAALAARGGYARQNRALAERRDATARVLKERYGFRVWPSGANFLLVDTRPLPARAIHEQLRERRVLVRYFPQRRLEHCLRISIGTADDMAALLTAMGALPIIGAADSRPVCN